MSTTSTVDLFSTLATEGELSPEAHKTIQIVDFGAAIQNAMGVKVDDVLASETTIVTVEIDDSGSIEAALNTVNIINGCNVLMDALAGSKQADSILMHLEMLNAGQLFPYVLLKNAVRLDHNNYRPKGGTPLYDKTHLLLQRALAKKKEFADNSVPARTVTFVATDGADVGSVHHSARSVRPLVEDMLRREEHIILAMGISDGGYTDFKAVLKEMGIPESCILTPGNTPSEIRKAFQFASQSAVRASQSAANFSKVKLGGFGA